MGPHILHLLKKDGPQGSPGYAKVSINVDIFNLSNSRQPDCLRQPEVTAVQYVRSLSESDRVEVMKIE